MKKIVVFLLACLTANMQCMELPIQQQQEIHENGLGSLSKLPDELIVYLFSFIPECTSMKEIYKGLAHLALVNTKFTQIADDAHLLNGLAKRFSEFHSQENSIRVIIDIMNGSKKYNSIVTILTYALTEETKNKVLIQLAASGSKDLVELLLNSRADVNATNDLGTNALIEASAKGRLDIVKLLLERGADVSAAHNAALIRATEASHLEVIKLLLDSGADVNDASGSDHHMSAYVRAGLMCSCGYNNANIVQLFIERGADMNAIARFMSQKSSS